MVHTREEYDLFHLVGGYALVEKTLAEDVASHIIRPSPKVRVGSVGFTSLDGLSPSAFKPSPSPKLRMRILKRDGYRCRICGRKPDDYLDLELHVHHIRKRANGGLTDEANLITLCNTCHKGLDPHEDFTLFDYIEEQNLTVEALIESIRNYRKLYFGSDADLIQDNDKK